jgi:hypothetical protein
VNSVKPPTVRFSGYRYNQQKRPELYLPGFKKAALARALVVDANGSYDGNATSIPMEWHEQNGHWRAEDRSGNSLLKSGVSYRFQVKESATADWKDVPLDFLEKVQIKNTQTGQQDTFNRIAKYDLESPKKSVPLIDILPDSILTQEQLKVLDQRERDRLGAAWQKPETDQPPAYQEGTSPPPYQERLPVYPMRDHFNKFNRLTYNPKAFAKAGNTAIQDPTAKQGFEDGLNEMLPIFKKAGFKGVVFKPFMGGDNLSSHRYWTTDPNILNDTFRSKQSFRHSLDLMLKNDMKVFADGAFVNQGMNGVQLLSNVRHKTQSPYWGWFHFSNQQSGGRTSYPSLAHEKYEFGLLPTKDNANGNPEIDYSAFAVRFINDPTGLDMNGKSYDKEKPSFIELYDPRLETAEGHMILPKERKIDMAELKNSKRSVQKYRFPVDPKELAKKKQASDEALPLGADGKPVTHAKYLDWDNFRLTVPGMDNSSKKWDGQIDVALMNTQNPEVVAYLQNAVRYWSNMVMNHYTSSVAEKMYDAQQKLGKDAKHEALIDAVTEGSGILAAEASLKVLPKKTHMAADLALPEVEKNPRPDFEREEIGRKFAETLIKNVPLNVLQLPVLFKANLNEPTFVKSLNQPRTGFSGFVENKVLGPMANIPVVGKPVEALSNFVFPPRLEKAIGRKMQQIFEEVSTDGKAVDKLRHQKVQNIVADRLGESFYLSLLTGKSLEESEALIQDPEKLESAIYESLPPSLMNASPQEAARRLPALLRKRLKDMNKPQANGKASLQVQVRDEVKKITSKLDPELVNLAAGVLNQLEFGLNWRLDAAKDVADIDGVRNAPDKAEKLRRFKQEINYLNQFWGDKMKSAMRDIFPNASVIAELTDFGELAGDDPVKGEELKKALFENNTFTSTPNMSHTYSPLSQLVHYAQRPDEFGATTLSPSEFMKEHIEPMTQELPLFAQRQLQNLSSSHDFSTTSHAMLLNPELFNMDRQKSHGLVEFFKVAADELANGASFAPQRKALKDAGFNDPQEAIRALKDWLDQPQTGGFVPGQLRALAAKDANFNLQAEFFDAKTKTSYTNPKAPLAEQNLYIPTPHDVKSKFVNALFHREILPAKLKDGEDETQKGAAQSEEHALHPLAKELNRYKGDPAKQAKMLETLSNALTARMSESSEARAMREAIGQAVMKVAGGNETSVQTEIWKGLDGAIGKWGSHFGYQALDVALNHVFEFAQPELVKQLGFDATEKLKVGIYNEALKPVMEKQERIFAIQNALPGNPSVYLPDLFAQGGSEYIKNTYVQNRSIIRADRLKDPQFQKYLEQVGKIFNSRSELPVLNDGIVLPIENMADADRQGILPIVRDNGDQQAIVLIDTGKPRENEKSRENMERKLYPFNAPNQAEPKKEDKMSSLNLKSQHLTPGSRYQDWNTKEWFKLDDDFNLKPTDENGLFTNGPVALKANRVLVRTHLG